MSDEAISLGSVLYRKHDSICTITLNKPETLNAIDRGPGSLQRHIIDAVGRADGDDEIKCIVITAVGRAFSAGGNIQGVQPETPMDWYRFISEADDELERLRDTRKPIIGALNGFCYGAALMMVCNFDFLIAVDTAEIGLIEARFGEPAVEALAYLVGPQWAKFLAITGELITAQKAKEIGLVLEVFPAETFMPKVYDLARRIAAIPSDAVTVHRRIVNASLDNMGWKSQKAVANALNGVLGSMTEEFRSTDGRKFSDIRKQDGWKAFKEARDAPFRPAWLAR